MSSSTNLEEKLTPNHLPSTADLQKEVEELENPEKEIPENLEDNPKSKLEYTFQFLYIDNQGKRWEGSFTHRIPNQAQREQIDYITARKKYGVAVDQWSMQAGERHYMHAHLQICLVKKPEWAEDLGALFDHVIVENLYSEVASHEAFFLGPEKNTDISEEKR